MSNAFDAERHRLINHIIWILDEGPPLEIQQRLTAAVDVARDGTKDWTQVCSEIHQLYDDVPPMLWDDNKNMNEQALPLHCDDEKAFPLFHVFHDYLQLHQQQRPCTFSATDPIFSSHPAVCRKRMNDAALFWIRHVGFLESSTTTLRELASLLSTFTISPQVTQSLLLMTLYKTLNLADSSIFATLQALRTISIRDFEDLMVHFGPPQEFCKKALAISAMTPETLDYVSFLELQPVDWYLPRLDRDAAEGFLNREFSYLIRRGRGADQNHLFTLSVYYNDEFTHTKIGINPATGWYFFTEGNLGNDIESPDLASLVYCVLKHVRDMTPFLEMYRMVMGHEPISRDVVRPPPQPPIAAQDELVGLQAAPAVVIPIVNPAEPIVVQADPIVVQAAVAPVAPIHMAVAVQRPAIVEEEDNENDENRYRNYPIVNANDDEAVHGCEYPDISPIYDEEQNE